MTKHSKLLPGILLCLAVVVGAVIINYLLPAGLLGLALLSLLLGMMLNP